MTSTRTSLWAVAPEDRPREKLERLGPGGLSDAELVALVLGSGLPGVNVLDNAASLLTQAGGVQELMLMTVRELMSLMGVGVATAGRVVAVAELWRRAHDPLPGRLVEHPRDLVDVVQAFRESRDATGHSRAAPATEIAGDGRAPAREAAGEPPTAAGHPAAAPATYVVVADHDLRVRVVVPLARDDGESIHALLPRVLHEVLYRGGAAFGLAEVRARRPDDTAQLTATRDVLKLASATVGLRFLSTVVMLPDSWEVID